jgi:cyclophilin family peptidyl-prolyl cis-trans isomerase
MMPANRQAEVQAAQKSLDFDKHTYQLELDTTEGKILLDMLPDVAPGHCKNLLGLAKIGYYDGLVFHRVIKGFMIQTGQIKDGYPCGVANIHDEFDMARSFAQPFALAMANAGHPNSGNCQVFITVAPQKSLDGSYTLFGQVVSGQDVAERISEVPVKNERPVLPVIIKSATIERRAR